MVVVVAIALVVLDITDDATRRWWARHSFTSSTVAGLLVLALTVFIADQVLARRSVKDRSQATAAQAVIVLAQATRTAKAVIAVRDSSGVQQEAADEVRTYLTMLLTAAPVLLDAKVSRNFLESAQHLGAHLNATLRKVTDADASVTAQDRKQLDDAVAAMRTAAMPLRRVLHPDQLRAAGD